MKPCGHRNCTNTATWRIRNLRACDTHKAAAEHMYPGAEAVALTNHQHEHQEQA